MVVMTHLVRGLGLTTTDVESTIHERCLTQAWLLYVTVHAWRGKRLGGKEGFIFLSACIRGFDHNFVKKLSKTVDARNEAGIHYLQLAYKKICSAVSDLTLLLLTC